jgi:hypothetical protein
MKKLQLHYSGQVLKIRTAVEAVNILLHDPEFYDRIKSYQKFDDSTLDPSIIAGLIEECEHSVTIIAHFFPTSSNRTFYDTIHLQRWNFPEHLPTAVNYLIREAVFALDCLYGLGHRKKRASESFNNSACLIIGAIAEAIVTERKINNREKPRLTLVED